MAGKIRITVIHEYTPKLEHYPGAKTLADCVEIDRPAVWEIITDAMASGSVEEIIEAVED